MYVWVCIVTSVCRTGTGGRAGLELFLLAAVARRSFAIETTGVFCFLRVIYFAAKRLYFSFIVGGDHGLSITQVHTDNTYVLYLSMFVCI